MIVCAQITARRALTLLKFTGVSGTSSPLTREFGIWYEQSWVTAVSNDGAYLVQVCQAYPDSVAIDGSWKAARAFQVLVFVFSFINLAVGLCASNSSNPMARNSSCGRIMAPLFLLTAVFQGLTLLFLDSTVCKANPLLHDLGGTVDWPDTCTISTGAKCYISATVFWAVAAFFSFKEQRALEVESSETDSDLMDNLIFDENN